MNARGWTILVIIVILVGAIVLYWTRDHGAPSGQAGEPGTIEAHFSCKSGKSIDATFVNVTQSTTTGNSVRLILSDGRSLTLPQAISADGGRYANADESFVFWNKGNTAFITENGTSTFDGCVAQG